MVCSAAQKGTIDIMRIQHMPTTSKRNYRFDNLAVAVDNVLLFCREMKVCS